MDDYTNINYSNYEINKLTDLDDRIYYEIKPKEDCTITIKLSDFKYKKSEKAIVTIHATIMDEHWHYIFYKDIFADDKEQSFDVNKYDIVTVTFIEDDKYIEEEDSSFCIEITPTRITATRKKKDYVYNKIEVSSIDPVYKTPGDGYLCLGDDSKYMFIPGDHNIEFRRENLTSLDTYYYRKKSLSIKFSFDNNICFISTYGYTKISFSYNDHQITDNIVFNYNDEIKASTKNIDSMLQEQYPNIKFT